MVQLEDGWWLGNVQWRPLDGLRWPAGVRGCPASHPVPVPSLELNFRWKISGPLSGVSLSSGGVHSGHADILNSRHQDVRA